MGLFVATDLPDLAKSSVFQQKRALLEQSLNGTNLYVWFRDEDGSNEANPTDVHPEPEVQQLFDLNATGWVGYQELFLDMQLAACASIGFVKAESSTFSNFIRILRRDNRTKTCDLL